MYTVLMVDDDEDDQLMIGNLFSHHCSGLSFDGVQNGQELIDRLEKPGELPPSLILLDLNMPLMNGFEVLEQLRASERLRAIPVVVLTNSEAEQDIWQSYALGANAFLTKPRGYEDLQTLVLHLRDFWLRQAHLPKLTPMFMGGSNC